VATVIIQLRAPRPPSSKTPQGLPADCRKVEGARAVAALAATLGVDLRLVMLMAKRLPNE
jgi:hypothetical protein